MTLIDFLLFLLIAAVAGGLGKLLAGVYPGGLIISILSGYLGALLGTWIARQFGLPAWLTINVGGTEFPFLWATLGAAIILAVISLIFRR
jgi:uncharacterized membrane protein YeaQ/YmgE (transglycosylase-associated protein family)